MYDLLTNDNIGDCLKLRAVNHPKLSHLVDCLVFASVARPGHKAAPSMSSGGDLDGNLHLMASETWSSLTFSQR